MDPTNTYGQSIKESLLNIIITTTLQRMNTIPSIIFNTNLNKVCLV